MRQLFQSQHPDGSGSRSGARSSARFGQRSDSAQVHIGRHRCSDESCRSRLDPPAPAGRRSLLGLMIDRLISPLDFSQVRLAPLSVLAGLREVDPTADLVHFGDARWLLVSVRGDDDMKAQGYRRLARAKAMAASGPGEAPWDQRPPHPAHQGRDRSCDAHLARRATDRLLSAAESRQRCRRGFQAR
jgi:hypothetical protein